MIPVRVGLIGLGNWGGRLAKLVSSIDELDLVTCFSRTEARRTAFAAEHGCAAAASLQALLGDEEVDAVMIATPHTTHEELVVVAAEAGKHVMVEKPLTLETAAAQRCVAAANAAGIVLQVAHYRRRLGATRAIRRLLDDGALGAVHHVEARFYRPMGPDEDRPWRADPVEAPAGGMTALGVHLVDNLHYLVGPVARLSARSKHIVAPTPIDDITDVLFEFESGCLGTLSTSVRLPYEATTAVYGSLAAAWSEEDGARLFVQRREEDVRRERPVDRIDGVRANLEHFAECVRTGAAPETGGPEGLAVVQVMEAITRSAASGGASVEVARVE